MTPTEITLAIVAVFVLAPVFIGCCIAAGSSPSVFPITPEKNRLDEYRGSNHQEQCP